MSYWSRMEEGVRSPKAMPYDPHAIERDYIMEARCGLRPPIDGVRMSEIGKCGDSWPYLYERSCLTYILPLRQRYFANDEFSRIELGHENASFHPIVVRRIRASGFGRADARIDDIHIVHAIGLQCTYQFRQTMEFVRIVGKVQVRRHGIDIRPLDIERKVGVTHSLHRMGSMACLHITSSRVPEWMR